MHLLTEQQIHNWEQKSAWLPS